MPDARPDPVSAVDKACRILRVMSDAKVTRLTDIATGAGLDKATTLRLLETLTRNGFVVRDALTKRYALGAELLVLGAATLNRFDPRPVVRPSLLRLAAAFEDTAILSIPSGSESLCVELEYGRYPIRANYLEVGTRRPLGVGAGSLALLAWLPDAERHAVLASLSTRLERHPRIDIALIEERIRDARSRGHVLLLDVVVERMGGIAVPILGADKRPVAAISMAALTDRITSREAAMAQALRREAAACEVLWSEAVSGRGAAAPRSVARQRSVA